MAECVRVACGYVKIQEDLELVLREDIMNPDGIHTGNSSSRGTPPGIPQSTATEEFTLEQPLGGRIMHGSVDIVGEYAAFSLFFRVHFFLGGDRSPRVWQYFHLLVTISCIPLLLWVGAFDQHAALGQSLMDPDHDSDLDTYTRMWGTISALVGVNLINIYVHQFKALYSEIRYNDDKTAQEYGDRVTRGHLLRLMSEVNMQDNSTTRLRFWLKWSVRMMMPAALYSLQGFLWVQWLRNMWADHGVFEGIVWTIFELLVIPSCTLHLTFFVVSVAIANAVVGAHCVSIEKRIKEETKKGLANDAQLACLVNDVMDRLHDLNTNLIPMLNTGWAGPIASTSGMCAGAALAVLWKIFNIDYNGQTSWKLADTTLSFILFFLSATLLLFPAMTSSYCSAVRIMFLNRFISC
jgi:hypothetical protein